MNKHSFNAMSFIEKKVVEGRSEWLMIGQASGAPAERFHAPFQNPVSDDSSYSFPGFQAWSHYTAWYYIICPLPSSCGCNASLILALPDTCIHRSNTAAYYASSQRDTHTICTCTTSLIIPYIFGN